MAIKRITLLILVLMLMAVVAIPLPLPAQGAQGWTGTVIGSGVNVRVQPSASAKVAAFLDKGAKVTVVGEVDGQAVEGNYSTWYQIDSGYYVYARYVARQAGSGSQQNGSEQSSGRTGRWLDADLSKQVLTAMEGDEPVYGAPITIGRVGWETPPGNYTILRKVENETMDSATIGIPRNSVGGYYLTNVLYTMYYTNGGHAIHYNYWVDPDSFGNAQTSRGCMGLALGDAEYFYNFADVGTPLIIHQ